MLSASLPTAPADVLVIPMSHQQQGYAISVATKLRSLGIRTQLYSEQKKFKAKITYAAKLGIPFALFLGEDEENAQSITYKNLNEGVQNTADFDTAAAAIRAELERLNQGSVISE
jgi:histidyl-tRNA synthetase